MLEYTRRLANRTSFVLVALVTITALGLLGCGRADREDASVTPSGGADGISPVSGQDYRRQRLASAMEGLIYGEDRVTVDPASSSPFEDQARAQEAILEGRTLRDNGYHVEAIEAFTRAVLAAPSTASPYRALAGALMTKGRLPEARAALRTALAIDPRSPDALAELGATYEASGDFASARGSYRTALEYAPDHGASHARLAVLDFLHGDGGAARAHLDAAEAAGAPVSARLRLLLDGGTAPSVVVRTAEGGGGPTIGPQLLIDTGGSAQANETTAAAAAVAPGVVVTGWNEYRNPPRIEAGIGVTLDGGATWSDFVVRPPAANQGAVEGDAMAAYDPRTGTLWVGAISFTGNGGAYVARKQPGAASFEPSVMTLVSGGADKGWLAAGRPPSTADATNLYVAYNLGLQTSTDMGDTWGPTVSLGGEIGYLPRVGPTGEVYVGSWDFGTGVRLRASLDGGATVGPPVLVATRMAFFGVFDTPHFPGEFRAPPLNYMAVDPNTGRLYFVWFDTTSAAAGESDEDLYITHSDDGGATWTVPAVFALPGDQFMPWLEVDDAGRLHLLYLDTRHTAQSDGDSVAFLDAYYAYSEDGGATWTEARLTPTSWSSALALTNGFQFIGDYLGMAVAGDLVYPVYLSTQNGSTDIFTHAITFLSALFADGFESGDTSAWSQTVP